MQHSPQRARHSLSLTDLIKCGTYDSVLNKKIKQEERHSYQFKQFHHQRDHSSKRKLITQIHHIFFRNFEINVTFFSKGSTPGILEINKINLLLPQIDCSNNWKKKEDIQNSPLPHSKSLHNLEDIDGTWMLMCTKMIDQLQKN